MSHKVRPSVLRSDGMLFAFILLAALAGCLPKPSNSEVRRLGNKLTIDGILDDSTQSRVRHLLDQRIEEVVLNSPGGSESAAIRIAEQLAEKDVTVVVQGECLSACAQYIFISGRRKEILNGSVVGCHENIIAMTKVPAEAYGSIMQTKWQKLSKRAIALYRRLGVSPDFAYICLRRTSPICYFTDKARRQSVAKVFDVWLPLASDFKRFGIDNVSGALENEDDMQRLGESRGLVAALPPFDSDLQAEYWLEHASYSCDKYKGAVAND